MWPGGPQRLHILVTIATVPTGILAWVSTEAMTSAHEAATTELVAGAVGDRCANCNAPLASDQRYCVNCGDRRGKARHSFGSVAPAVATGHADEAGRHDPTRPYRSSAGLTLVASVATLLIAMGVGVLIGRSSNSTPTRASQPVVVTAGSGSAGVASTANNATNTAATHKGKSKKVKAVVVHINAKVSRAASQAASHVFGGSGNLSNNVAQSQGGSCSGGAGCQNGKFTGNFFGP
jgi:hypothetical protein